VGQISVGDRVRITSAVTGEEIGEEVHADHDQFFRVEKG
jgi:hypothetical protein